MDRFLIRALAPGNFMGGQARGVHEEAAALHLGQQGDRLRVPGIAFGLGFGIRQDALRCVWIGVLLAFKVDGVIAVVVVAAFAGQVVLLAVALGQGDGDLFAGFDLDGSGVGIAVGNLHFQALLAFFAVGEPKKGALNTAAAITNLSVSGLAATSQYRCCEHRPRLPAKCRDQRLRVGRCEVPLGSCYWFFSQQPVCGDERCLHYLWNAAWRIERKRWCEHGNVHGMVLSTTGPKGASWQPGSDNFPPVFTEKTAVVDKTLNTSPHGSAKISGGFAPPCLSALSIIEVVNVYGINKKSSNIF